MTLAFALRGSNGLVLAADSRVSLAEGNTADTSIKFLQINREVGVVTYGLAVPGYHAITKLAEEVNRTLTFGGVGSAPERRMVYFSDIAKAGEKVFKAEFDDFYASLTNGVENPIPKGDLRLQTGFILAGYDSNETNQFKILNWVSPDFKRSERIDILAGQWPVSQYLENILYYHEMDVEQLKRLAIFLLVETETVAPSVGGALQVATITLENGFQRLNEQEIRKLICENQFRFAEFRKDLLKAFS